MSESKRQNSCLPLCWHFHLDISNFDCHTHYRKIIYILSVVPKSSFITLLTPEKKLPGFTTMQGRSYIPWNAGKQAPEELVGNRPWWGVQTHLRAKWAEAEWSWVADIQ